MELAELINVTGKACLLISVCQGGKEGACYRVRKPTHGHSYDQKRRKGFHVVGRALLLEARLSSPGEKKLPVWEAWCLMETQTFFSQFREVNSGEALENM